MTLRGVFREVAAAQRRAARNEERRQRAHARAAKLQAKLDELEHAAAEAEEYSDRISQLTTIHHAVGDAMDWGEISARPQPVEPSRLSRWEDAAVRERDQFKPTFWQRLFGKEEKLRAQFERDIVEARQRDDVSYQGALKLHRQQSEQWQDENCLATAIVAGDLAAYRSALEELEPLSEMQEMGCEFEVSFPDARTALVDLKVESEKLVPRESKTLTRSGKLSVKAVPQGKFFELYQDYVCGCVLRTGREFFSFLPLSRVVVNVNATLLDTASGHLREQTILSVGMPRSTCEGMNFESVDPSDAMPLFPHRMGFKRSQGFFAIPPLTPPEYPTL
jgi:hypothetical protein